MRRTLAVLALLAVTRPDLAADEAPPKVTAAGPLGARAQGPKYRVVDPVDASGYFYGFDFRTDYDKLGAQAPERAKAELRTSKLELRVSGTVSAKAKQEFAALGYVVREGEPPQ